MNYSTVIKGDCHCGNIHSELHTNKKLEDFVPRVCQCDLCKKHGAQWISDPEGLLQLTYKNKDDVNQYQFGHKTSDFIVCKNCGVLTTAVCDIQEKTRAVINITPFLETSFTAKPIQTVFDAENVKQRLARRGKNWTGQVEIKE